MPHYFFNVSDNDNVRDVEGVELSSLHSAQREAVKLAGALLREAPERIGRCDGWRVVVADEIGATLFTVEVMARLSSM